MTRLPSADVAMCESFRNGTVVHHRPSTGDSQLTHLPPRGSFCQLVVRLTPLARTDVLLNEKRCQRFRDWRVSRAVICRSSREGPVMTMALAGSLLVTHEPRH